jgi:hypothetical protein
MLGEAIAFALDLKYRNPAGCVPDFGVTFSRYLLDGAVKLRQLQQLLHMTKCYEVMKMGYIENPNLMPNAIPCRNAPGPDTIDLCVLSDMTACCTTAKVGSKVRRMDDLRRKLPMLRRQKVQGTLQRFSC